MSAIDQYIERIPNKELQEQLRTEIARLTQKKKFGLVFENHLPDNITLPEVKIRCGTKVVLRDSKPNVIYEVQSISDDKTAAVCRHLVSLEDKTFNMTDLIAVAQRGDVIYPYLQPMDSVMNAPDSELWHTLIEADNYHALQLLAYLYPGKVDCIYIDPPYNKPNSHDWKYNCDYVDKNDKNPHSKWLAMMEARLKIAKKLLNPENSVLIVTIDELEYHHLGCLLEQMFPEADIQMISTVINPKGSSRTGRFSRVEEYIYFVYFGNSIVYPNSNDMLRDCPLGNKREVRWAGLMRQGIPGRRSRIPSLFYPIFIDKSSGRFHSIGDPLDPSADRNTVICPEGTIALFPINTRGEEQQWSLYPPSFKEYLEKGYIKFGKMNNAGKRALYYLQDGMVNKIKSGAISIVGKDEDGSLLLEYSDNLGTKKPSTLWHQTSHSASENGTTYLNRIIGNRFSYPKSLYAVHDTLRFFVANNPNALILDFFAGSGTTLHAVNLLNREDGGHRKCIMVTNNEIGEPKENELSPMGIRPGDSDWEKWGIARYVNWPRTRCTILGNDVNGMPMEGEYITSNTETKSIDRKFFQINYLAENASLKQKKALVSLINKQKDVKLPTMNEDAGFLVSEDDDYNASILFELNETDAWLEALEGNSHITNFYIVAAKDTKFKSIKAEVAELMGQIEETVPVRIPMSEGFKTNATFFKLGFLDKRAVSKGKQLKELLPLLWMKAGSKGECPTEISRDYAFFPKNKMAVLVNESLYPRFKDELSHCSDIEVVYIITDSQSAYLNMIQDLKGLTTYQLYRDYLENFRINYAVK